MGDFRHLARQYNLLGVSHSELLAEHKRLAEKHNELGKDHAQTRGMLMTFVRLSLWGRLKWLLFGKLP